jgi:hypothetical protein
MILGHQVVETFVLLQPTLNPIVILVMYSVLHLVEMVVSVNNMEDVIGGHVWVGILCITGGIGHKPFAWARRAFVFGEAYFFLQFSCYFFNGVQLHYILGTHSLSK